MNYATGWTASRAWRPPSAGGIATVAVDPVEDAVSALVGLGYKPNEASRMVRGIDAVDLSSEEIIRQALQATVQSARPCSRQPGPVGWI